MMIKTTVQQQVDWLAQFGLTEDGGVTRLLYTAEWQQAQQALRTRMEQGGLTTDIDAVGNVFGRIEGTQTDDIILTGSHVDTVVNGGKLDGAYGVIASIVAVTELLEEHGRPKKTLEVVSLCEEEGSRFPLTFWGSRSVVGQYNLAHMDGVIDQHGIPLHVARAACGIDGVPTVRRVNRFVELHIEQGQVLERKQKDIGVVTHIVGQRRYTITIRGESNHAGTTPMPYRQDALVAAATCIARFTEEANAFDDTLVATTGQMHISPNVPNVIANDVKFTLDVRHYDEATIIAYCEKIFSALAEIAAQHGVTYGIEQWLDVAPVAMDAHVNEWVKTYLQQHDISYEEMVSGAGHDAQVFGEVVPTTLLFVPSKDGISHSPKEYTAAEQLQTGIDVLKAVLYQLAY
ncbi:MAG: Zn-dependent hydrolase [Caryophanon sp.]|nr:Zn-dependent hydrolase [Caryophanon sp.]